MIRELFIKNWVELLFAFATFIMTYGYRTLAAKIKEEEERNANIAAGVRCLLRKSIVETYKECVEQGYCTLDERTTIEKSFTAYTGLGGNDVAEKLYHKILDLPTEPPLDY